MRYCDGTEGILSREFVHSTEKLHNVLAFGDEGELISKRVYLLLQATKYC